MSNGKFGVQESQSYDILLFAHHVSQNHLNDGYAQEVCSHTLSISPYIHSLPKRFLHSMEISFVADDNVYSGTKYLESLAKDNFQLAIIKTDGSQFTNVEKIVLSIGLPKIFSITKPLYL